MWSKEAKKFFYDPENVYDCLKFSQLPATANLYQDMVWQQFTGLKDSKGVEIYEGDIVEDPYLGNFIVEYVNDSEGSHFILSPENNEDQGYILPIDNDYTVVGNIFEK